MKTQITPEQRQALALAKSLYGVEKIRAYQLAGREDLALKAANEEIVLGQNYNGRPKVYAPYNRWSTLEKKKEFDRKGIPYSPEAVKEALRNIQIEVCGPLTFRQIKRIEFILQENGLNDRERMAIFEKARDRDVPKCRSDDTFSFWYHQKETGYSTLATHTGIPRTAIVGQYLDAMFEQPRDIVYGESPNRESHLARFIDGENIPGEEVVPRAVKAFEKLDSLGVYHLAHMISHAKNVVFPREIVLGILRNLAREHPICNNIYNDRSALPLIKGLENDPEIYDLRRDSLRHLIENNPCCVALSEKEEIRKYGITLSEPWFKESLKRDLKKCWKSVDEYELRTVVDVAKEYGLLHEKKISALENRVKLLKRIKGGNK